MHVFVEESIEFASYRLKDVAYNWAVMQKNSRGEDATPITWKIFWHAFLDKFFLLEIREAKIEEFMNLRQGSMTVKEYCLKFNQLSKYAPDQMADPRSSMSKFVTGVSGLVVKECRTAMLNRDMDLSRLMMHAK